MFSDISFASTNKEKIVNENFDIQAAFNYGIIDRTLTTPPTSPSSLGFYIPAATATGLWAGKENKLMWWNAAGYWMAIEPVEGIKINSQQEDNFLVYKSGIWNGITTFTVTVQATGLAPTSSPPDGRIVLDSVTPALWARLNGAWVQLT
jgi:hypothetical protein